MEEFDKYFNMDKDTLKFLLFEYQTLDEITEVDKERIRAIKLALVACDETAGLSTMEFNGTLNLNEILQPSHHSSHPSSHPSSHHSSCKQKKKTPRSRIPILRQSIPNYPTATLKQVSPTPKNSDDDDN